MLMQMEFTAHTLGSSAVQAPNSVQEAAFLGASPLAWVKDQSVTGTFFRYRGLKDEVGE